MNGLIEFLTEIRWQDIVDILLNGYILFRLYVLFRSTNVLRVIAGLAFLWVFQRIAVELGLIVTSWALQGFIAGLALLIVIVFRNEIRRVLQIKDLRTLLWGFSRKSERTPIDRVVEGVFELARNRVGALIVIQGKEDLDETVQSGVTWLGQISREMLVSIFWNGNPVHDGAALIDGDRIIRVGCILPLSSRDDLPGYYGTRHRAAIGLAEVCDAMVIVVSEERAEVAVAKKNTVVAVPDPQVLTTLLHDHLGSSPGEDVSVARKEKKELGIAAAISMICVAVVWFSFARGNDTLTSLEVPLEYRNRDPKVQVVSTSDNSVRLYLTGSRPLINALRADQVRVQLDLHGAKYGENRFRITKENIVIPPGVRLDRIEPSEIKLELDIFIAKSLPVQVDWVDTLPVNVRMESLEVEPTRVSVEGPTHILSKLATLYTQPLSLQEVTGSGELSASLVLEPTSLKLAEDADNEVLIRYSVLERQTVETDQ
jgi:uncharacterized protein (TIGR00159 family)